MARRAILLMLAAVMAVAGAGMVFLYVRGADDRAKAAQAPVAVLKAVSEIAPGETLADASAAGKITLEDVPAQQQLPGAMNTIGEAGAQVALTRIFPNEQITSAKFGSPGSQDALSMPPGTFAISLDLSDTGRVAGFVTPGSKVALFANGPVGPGGGGRAGRGGSDHRDSGDDHDGVGCADNRVDPPDGRDDRGRPEGRREGHLCLNARGDRSRSARQAVKGQAWSRHDPSHPVQVT